MKEQRWEISGEFIDEGAVPGPAFGKFLEYDHNLKTDAYIRWMGVRPPKITPSCHKLPREEWAKYY